MKQLLLMLIAIVVMGGAGCVPPEPVPRDETIAFERAARVEEENGPAVMEVPKAMPMPGQRKPLPGAEEEIAAQACPICTATGMSAEQASRPHTHAAHEIIDHANTQARLEPHTEDYFNSVQVYDYIQGGLYQLYAAPLRETSIILQPGEDIGSVSAGDTKRWVFANVVSGAGDASQNIILVKPTKAGLETNMVITTDKRTYLIELTSYKRTYMAAISWHYPHEEMIAQLVTIQKTREAAREIIATNVRLEDLNFGYTITGKTNPRWKPVRVFDDGRKTFIQFPSALRTTEAPALFIRSTEGKTQLVNYRVKGTYYIVDRLFDLAELRVGEKNPMIVRIIRNTAMRRAGRAAPRS